MKNEPIIHEHGGDLDAIERKYHIPKAEIWDFSGNINPLGFPKEVASLLREEIHLVSTYPDKNYRALKTSIAAYTGARISDIAVGNGSTELIALFIQAVAPKKALLLAPAYSEYEKELIKGSSTCIEFPLDEQKDFLPDMEELLRALTEDIDLFIACNPNNPTGSAITAVQMERLVRHCQQRQIAVMIDETYIEFNERVSDFCSIPLAERYENLFVIRGISKFFAAPGLRLGYGVTSNKKFQQLLALTQDPWSVNSLAAFAGEHLFFDEAFINQSRQLILSEREALLQELSTWKNIKVYPSFANFILLKLLTDKVTSESLFEHLIQKKMLLRDAKSFSYLDNTFLRFCILLPQQNAALLAELKKMIEE